MRKMIVAVVFAAVIAAAGLAAQDALAKASDGGSDWGALGFLMGDWSGDEGGAMGQGNATVTVRPELGGALLVCHHRLDYPATRKHTGTVEQELLVIQRDTEGKARGVMFDTAHNEDHYAIDISPDGKTITLTSEAQPSVPRHRMVWVRTADREITFTHLMASPTSPDEFVPETAGKVQRK